MAHTGTKKALQDIENAVLAHRYLYYVESSPVIDDFAYDSLEKEAVQLLPKSSPVQSQVGSSLESSYPEEVISLAQLWLNNAADDRQTAVPKSASVEYHAERLREAKVFRNTKPYPSQKYEDEAMSYRYLRHVVNVEPPMRADAPICHYKTFEDFVRKLMPDCSPLFQPPSSRDEDYSDEAKALAHKYLREHSTHDKQVAKNKSIDNRKS